MVSTLMAEVYCCHERWLAGLTAKDAKDAVGCAKGGDSASGESQGVGGETVDSQGEPKADPYGMITMEQWILREIASEREQ